MNSSNRKPGAWIFVSHSHRDLEKVRPIRNEPERRGHNPLLFFLKCLEADDARRPELIRDEIKATTYFVLCNTRASRPSKWVKQEMELVNASHEATAPDGRGDESRKGIADGASQTRPGLQARHRLSLLRGKTGNSQSGFGTSCRATTILSGSTQRSGRDGIGPPFSIQPLMVPWREDSCSSC